MNRFSARLGGLVLGFSAVWLSACVASSGAEAVAEQVTLENKGSDTMVNLALAWAEAYQAQVPEVRLSVTGGGSGTGIAALINGTVDIANASRAIKDEERTEALANNIEPVEFVVARDAIAIVVNLSNPVSQLTLPQLSAIYRGEITNWRDVGGEDRPIVLLSRESNSGTHVFFLEHVIRLGEAVDDLFAPETLLLPSSEGITAEVRQNPNAIGYDGLGYVTPKEKVLAIAKDENSPYYLPNLEAVEAQNYPIARDLYIYTNGQPSGAVQAYVDWLMGDVAQEIVAELGFVPIRR